MGQDVLLFLHLFGDKYSLGKKKVITLTFLRRAKEPDFGAGVLVYLDFLCIDTPIHAKAPGPAPPQIYKPEKQPF